MILLSIANNFTYDLMTSFFEKCKLQSNVEFSAIGWEFYRKFIVRATVKQLCKWNTWEFWLKFSGRRQWNLDARPIFFGSTCQMQHIQTREREWFWQWWSKNVGIWDTKKNNRMNEFSLNQFPFFRQFTVRNRCRSWGRPYRISSANLTGFDGFQYAQRHTVKLKMFWSHTILLVFELIQSLNVPSAMFLFCLLLFLQSLFFEEIYSNKAYMETDT